MKRSLFFISVCFVCFGLYAEEEALQNTEIVALPPLVFDTIYQSEFLNSGKFLLLNGTYLNYEEMKERLLTIPGNEKYLNRAKGYEIGGFIGLGVGVAACIAYIAFSYIPNLPNRDFIKEAMFATSMLGYLGGAVSFNYSQKNLHRATQNYNLSVMGIPIQ